MIVGSMVARADAVHLLRRTEFVARPARVAALTAMSREQAVDDVLAVAADPGSVTFGGGSANWQRGQELARFWIDRMAHDSPRPLQEKLGLFWHGHFVSSLDKVEDAHVMREQIDLFRRDGMGNVRDLAITMSKQVAMIRYLDNNDNFKDSPNQNFGRELMELFLLGVGNYTEADVEANTAAWTGHGDHWDTDQYVWRPHRHDSTPRPFLGRMTCSNANPAEHGPDAIRTILSDGTATAGPGGGQPTREIAADFLSTKLWTFFAGTPIPDNVRLHLRNTLVANDFAVRPWLRELLLRDEFYAPATVQGLVRSPVEYVVAMMAATGARAERAPLWLMDGMGQQLLYPPNVAGWKHNGYYISASAFDARVQAALQMFWNTARNYWRDDDSGWLQLAGGNVPYTEVIATSPRDWDKKDTARQTQNAANRRAMVDRFVSLMGLDPALDVSGTTRAALHDFATAASPWDLYEAIGLVLMSPELHVA